MLKVHHLEKSRSTRILWLLEELAIPYELVIYKRHPVTIRAPESLKAIHPLGKAPTVEDNGLVIGESGAIIEYLVDTYGDGRLAPARSDPEHARYLEWLHYAEGSAMLPIMVTLLAAWTGGLSEGLKGFIAPEVDLTLDYLAASVEPSGYLLASGFSAADIQMSYVVGSARMGGMLASRSTLTAYLDRIEGCPAYRKAVEVGGPAYAVEAL